MDLVEFALAVDEEDTLDLARFTAVVPDALTLLVLTVLVVVFFVVVLTGVPLLALADPVFVLVLVDFTFDLVTGVPCAADSSASLTTA